jgi:hypothetical protein
MKGSIVWIISVILIVYLGLCGWLWLRQRSLIYYPTPSVNNPLAEELLLESDREVLQIWRVSQGNEHAVIYFGGNAEDVSQNSAEFLRYLDDLTVYLVNYRGYGGSSGSPAESGLFLDALSVYDFVARQHAEISVIGRSLGSGVATYLAAARTTNRLVLVTPFDSLDRVAQAAFPLFPVSLLMQDRFDSLGRASRIRVPTLIMIAEHDEIIARGHSENLAAAIDPSLLEVRVIDGAGHNTIGSLPQYERLLSAFLRGKTDAHQD